MCAIRKIGTLIPQHQSHTPEKTGETGSKIGLSLTKASEIQHTLGHLRCPACEKLRAEMICSISPEMEFSAAAQRWMESRSINALPDSLTARYIRKNTEESYRQYITSLGLFFAGHKLGDIHMGHFAAYQRARLQGAEPFIRKRRPQDKLPQPSPVKPKKVNQELSLLQHIMQRANCWSGEMEEISPADPR